VTGHQPAFIHPGVWAKHIVSMRLANSLGGIALNLVVDQDAPQGATLDVPAVEGSRVELRNVRYGELRAGCAYEQLARQTPDEIVRFERAVREAMGERYETSQMPMFVHALSTADEIGDGTEQSVAARRAVEATFEVSVEDRRVSRLWWTPLLLEMLGHAERFARSYNSALAWYRKEFRVRGRQRPIPDLTSRGAEWELPVWAYRSGETRRRLFAVRTGNGVRLLADGEEIGCFALDDFAAFNRLISPLECVLKPPHPTLSPTGGEGFGDALLRGPSEWRLRPRALTLTIWARLFLADLFIHGIGGAKYDRISDAIIADYFGLEAPEMACVSATLLLDLPQTSTTPETIRDLRRSLRGLEWNPQRALSSASPTSKGGGPPGPGSKEGGPPGLPPEAGLATFPSRLRAWIEQRERAVRRAAELREAAPHDRSARRAAFLEIRELNRQLGTFRSDELVNRRAELQRALDDLHQNRVALGREYFFGLYGR
ncbi:MAG: hypothetical protein AAB385_02570, partial [Planctomycetota bacterium]